MPRGIYKRTAEHANNFKDITGEVFGRLTVTKYIKTEGYATVWRCLCSCGKYRTVRASNLRNGSTKSCGCLFLESTILKGHKNKGKKHPGVNRTHGLSSSPTYKSWCRMKQRCTNSKSAGWLYYGGAMHPVLVCKRWLTFDNFVADMGLRPKGTTLSRYADTGDYKPGNCAWHTKAQQVKEHYKKIK